MATGSFKKIRDDIENDIQAMIERGRSLSNYFNRVLYPLYKKAQIERWQTHNASQGQEWAPLNQAYKKQKMKKFASYPGGGMVLMTATGLLERAAEGKENGLKEADDSMLRVSVDLGAVPYAPYPGVMRPFMIFSDDQEYNWAYDATRYVMGGV